MLIACCLLFEAFVENVDANDGHFTFGIVGSAWLYPALAAGGQGDLALKTLLTDTYPGIQAIGNRTVGNSQYMCVCMY